MAENIVQTDQTVLGATRINNFLNSKANHKEQDTNERKVVKSMAAQAGRELYAILFRQRIESYKQSRFDKALNLAIYHPSMVENTVQTEKNNQGGNSGNNLQKSKANHKEQDTN